MASDGVAIALAAKVPSLAPGIKSALSLSMGYYNGSTALAAGVTAAIPDAGSNAQLFATLGVGGRTGNVGASMGMQWSW